MGFRAFEIESIAWNAGGFLGAFTGLLLRNLN